MSTAGLGWRRQMLGLIHPDLEPLSPAPAPAPNKGSSALTPSSPRGGH